MFSKIKAVKVQKIIMEGAPSVIGTIKYNGLEDPTPLDTNNLPSAKPLFYNFSQYPAVNEVVYILVLSVIRCMWLPFCGPICTYP